MLFLLSRDMVINDTGPESFGPSERSLSSLSHNYSFSHPRNFSGHLYIKDCVIIVLGVVLATSSFTDGSSTQSQTMKQ